VYIWGRYFGIAWFKPCDWEGKDDCKIWNCWHDKRHNEQQSKQFITEVGKTASKSVVTEVESAIVNSIENTPVRGYEVFKQDVTLTVDGQYRAYVGLRLPMGKLNKMYEYTIEQAVDAYQSKDKSQHETIWDDLVSSDEEVEDENSTVQ